MRLPLEPGLFICVLSVCIKLFKLILKEYVFYFDKMEPKFLCRQFEVCELKVPKEFFAPVVCLSVCGLGYFVIEINQFVCSLTF